MEKVKEPIEVFALSGMMWKLKVALRKRNIIVRTKNNLEDVSPMAVVGKRSEKFLQDNFDKYGKSISNTISLKKNFAKMISRNPDNYESNFKVNPSGENVDVKNETKYIIISFIELYRPLFKIDGGIYSSLNDREFSDLICKHERIPFPFPKEFNWKHYLKLIAEACLENYDKYHIIMIRTMPKEWYVDGDVIGMNEQSRRDLRNFIREAEDWFIEKTHCHCVEESLGIAKPKGDFKRDDYYFDYIANAIAKIINGAESFCDLYKYVSPISRRLYARLNRDTFEQIESFVKAFDVLNEREYENKIFGNEIDNPVLRDIGKMVVFLQVESFYLSDYYRKNRQDYNLGLVELYAKYFKINIDDLLTIIKIYFESNDKELMRKCVINVCSNLDCYPIKLTKQIIKENIEYLLKYNSTLQLFSQIKIA